MTSVINIAYNLLCIFGVFCDEPTVYAPNIKTDLYPEQIIHHPISNPTVIDDEPCDGIDSDKSSSIHPIVMKWPESIFKPPEREQERECSNDDKPSWIHTIDIPNQYDEQENKISFFVIHPYETDSFPEPTIDIVPLKQMEKQKMYKLERINKCVEGRIESCKYYNYCNDDPNMCELHINMQKLDNLQYIVWSHTNDADILSVHNQIMYLYERLKRSVGFIVYDYRGFGFSKGKPSEQNCVQDLTTMINMIHNKMKLTDNELILVGHSMGTSVVMNYCAIMDCSSMLVAFIAPYEQVLRHAMTANTYNSLKIIRSVNNHQELFDMYPNEIKHAIMELDTLKFREFTEYQIEPASMNYTFVLVTPLNDQLYFQMHNGDRRQFEYSETFNFKDNVYNCRLFNYKYQIPYNKMDGKRRCDYYGAITRGIHHGSRQECLDITWDNIINVIDNKMIQSDRRMYDEKFILC